MFVDTEGIKPRDYLFIDRCFVAGKYIIDSEQQGNMKWENEMETQEKSQ